MEGTKEERVQKPLRFKTSIITRINKIRGVVQADNGESYSDQEFYTMLILEGVKKFEEKYNQSN